MRVVATTNDPVRLSFLLALLEDSGIEAFVFDTHASIVEGSIGVIPRRIMVANDEYAMAAEILRNAPEI